MLWRVTQSLEAHDPDGGQTVHPLDDVVRAALTGPHAHFAEGGPRVLRYPPQVTPWVAVPAELDDKVWAEAGELLGLGGRGALAGPASLLDRLPDGWGVEFQIEGLQMVATEMPNAEPNAEQDPEIVVLGADHVEEMLDLVRRTEPGPFEAKTYLLGQYLGIRRDGKLIAMAGERMHPPGWTEISAVCTDPAFRGQGLAARVIRAVAQGIIDRGEMPFLHVAASNLSAIRVYESLGFVVRRPMNFYLVRAPER
jgi:ribosomal protein S18 acetylase RimI-like enzyme